LNRWKWGDLSCDLSLLVLGQPFNVPVANKGKFKKIGRIKASAEWRIRPCESKSPPAFFMLFGKNN